MTSWRLIGPVVIGALAGCPTAPTEPPSPPDAGGPAVLASSRHGYRLPLLPAWRAVPPGASTSSVQRLASARRTDGKPPFVVAPRIEITTEPSTARDAESAYQGVKASLEALGDQRGVEMIRTSLGFRPVGPAFVGDLNARYRVGGPDGREVRHRSLLVWRMGLGGQTEILSITATFLAVDLDRVEPEIQRMFAGLQLTKPVPADSGDPPR